MRRYLNSAPAILAAAILLVVAAAPIARADHEDGTYEIPSEAEYPYMEFDVLVIPPEHGQLYNGESGLLNGSDPSEIGMNNSYLKATLAAIAEWNNGVQIFGSQALRDAFRTNVYVAGMDPIPLDIALDPDILVFTDENEGILLGTAYHLNTPVSVAGNQLGTCAVRSSRMELLSYTYADMYNVMAQEFGHCLGLGHVGSQGGFDPTSEPKHPEHDVMNGFYTHSIGNAGTHQHCVSNLDIAGLEWNLEHLDGTRGISFMTVDGYRTTCDVDGSEPPAPSSSPRPTPRGTASPSPSPSPSASPSPSQSSSPTVHRRTVSLELRGHLTANGRISAPDEFSECKNGARVRILRKVEERWISVRRTVASIRGAFSVRLPDRQGRYMARIAESPMGQSQDRCGAALAIARHRH